MLILALTERGGAEDRGKAVHGYATDPRMVHGASAQHSTRGGRIGPMLSFAPHSACAPCVV